MTNCAELKDTSLGKLKQKCIMTLKNVAVIQEKL